MSKTIRVLNPSDATGTFDYIRLYATSAEASANISGSTFTYVSASASIDTTTYISLDNPGFTDIQYSAGTSAFWYAATFYNTATSTESDLTPAKDRVPGRGSRLRVKLQQKLRDLQNKVWSNDELDDICEKAANSLFPHLGRETKDTTMVTSANVREYPIPAGFFRVDNIYLGTVGSDYSEYQNYYVNGNKIVFGDTPQDANRQITLYGLKRFDNIWDVPLVYEDILLAYSMAEAFSMLQVDRSKFKQYAELVKDKDLTVNEITTMIRDWRNIHEHRLRQLEKPGQPTEMRYF